MVNLEKGGVKKPIVVVVVAVYYCNIVIDSGYHCRLQLCLFKMDRKAVGVKQVPWVV